MVNYAIWFFSFFSKKLDRLSSHYLKFMICINLPNCLARYKDVKLSNMQFMFSSLYLECIK